MTGSRSFAVVIATFDRRETLSRTLDSLKECKMPAGFFACGYSRKRQLSVLGDRSDIARFSSRSLSSLTVCEQEPRR